jgi:hypothetical protein
MFELFGNIFTRQSDTTDALPPEILKAATERAVDGTDPRLRILSGYARKLRKGVTHAALHAIGLIDRLPAPTAVNRQSLGGDRAVKALFYSWERCCQLLASDPAMRDFRAANPEAEGTVTALLVAERTEKQDFGYGKLGDQVVKDMARTTVSFLNHRLLEPSLVEQDTRRLLKRRAFDHLLGVALNRITERKEERTSLVARRALLRSKLDIIQRGAGFDVQTAGSERSELQERMEAINSQLEDIGESEDVLPDNLALIASILENAEQHLWVEEPVLCLDKFYVLHDEPGESAPATRFHEVHNSEGRSAVALLVELPCRLE